MGDNMETDQELLDVFLEESREHLDGIETDLLDIETAGADFDDDLVNKVFRAAHSIKGAAGFFGLGKVKELSHAMENILGKIRSRDLLPTSERIGVLLSAADQLSSMINNIETSEQADIQQDLQALQNSLDTAASAAKKTETKIPDAQKPKQEAPKAQPVSTDPAPALSSETGQQEQAPMDIYRSTGSKAFSIDYAHILAAASREQGGRFFYILEMDLCAIPQGESLADFVIEHAQMVEIVDAAIDIEALYPLNQFPENPRLPFCSVISTSLDSETLGALLDDDKISVRPLPVKLPQSLLPSLPQTAAVATTREDLTPPDPHPSPSPSPEPEATAHQAVASQSGDSVSQAKSEKKPRTAHETSIRVRLSVLDSLMTLAGELVLTRNQLLQSLGQDMSKTVDASQRIDLVTTELQDAIMSTRMQSIAQVFHKFKRMVRDIGQSLDKDVQLVLEGEDVELDKTIIEAISDPLTHLVRNSLDHGIEPRPQRLAQGKPQQGTLRLSAMHRAGSVIIEIEDDGGGIDPQKVKQKALDNKLFSKNQLDAMSDQALVKLIFMPGFSLAKEVTDLSGRGVGMDVVHSELSKLGGLVDIESSVGIGTMIRVKLPLTLAIIPCILVDEEGASFAIPQASLVELQRVAPNKIAGKIEKIGDALVMRLRGELLPLIRLRDALGMQQRSYVNIDNVRDDDLRQNIADRRQQENEVSAETIQRRQNTDRRYHASNGVNIAVVAAGDFRFGIIVEALQDSLEIVVKPLGRHLVHCAAYAGATILGDGRPALILDVNGLSKGLRENQRAEDSKQGKEKIGQIYEQRELLIVEGPMQRQYAVPLQAVERIERVQTKQIQRVAQRLSMNYHDHSLRVGGLPFDAEPDQDQGNAKFVVVFQQAGQEMGLLVHDVVDVITWQDKVDNFTHRQPGVAGSFYLDTALLLLIDLANVARHIAPDIIPDIAPDIAHGPALNSKNSGAETTGTARTVASKTTNTPSSVSGILVVDDSALFRKKISGLVKQSGYAVFTADDGDTGLQELEAHADEIQLLLTDIEMPRLDGFGFASKIRQQSRFDRLPIIAVTTLLSQDAKNKGRDIGIDEHLVKLDAELLLQRVEHWLKHGRGPS